MVPVWLALGARAMLVWLARDARALLVWLARAVLIWLARGARAVLIWLACGALLARPRCMSCSFVILTLSFKGSNHQPSRLPLLSTQALMGARTTHEAYFSRSRSSG